MIEMMHGPVSFGVQCQHMQNMQQPPAVSPKLAGGRLSRVIEIHTKSDADIFMDLLKKLPASTPSCGRSRLAPAAATAEVGSGTAGMHDMTSRRAGMPAPWPLAGIRPPPGLWPRGPSTQGWQGEGGAHRVDLRAFNPKCTHGVSEAATDEQSSTNDDGERNGCESFASEDDVAPAHCSSLMQSCKLTGAMTTLMVRNIPVMYTQDLLLQEWKNEGTYDFLYVPRTCKTNLSYAFINFLSEDHAIAFQAQWHKKRLAHFSARKPLTISAADVQGLRDNLMQLKKKRMQRIEMRQCQPLIIMNGRQVDLTEALASLQA